MRSPDGFIIPVHKSITEPMLWGGVPRDFLIINATAAMAIGVMLKLYPFIILNVAAHIAAKMVTKKDALFFKALVKHIKEPRYFET